MRVLMNVRFPHQPFNALVKEGTAATRSAGFSRRSSPKAAYFTEQNGHRGAVLVVDMPGPSRIPALAEPFFLTFQADVEFRIAMTIDDLKKTGLDEIGQEVVRSASLA